jgi:hypothetical protein
MKRNSTKLLTAAILLATGQQAFAAATGTLAGQTVSNTANVSYTVSGVSQTAAFNNPAATFKVDRKVNVTVAAADTTSSPNKVAPKANDQVLTFTVTNTTNDTMDFHLGTANATGDDFDVTSFNRYYVESGATPGYQSAEDTATYIDELPSGDAKTVYVLANIPDTNGTNIANTKQSGVVLTATARAGGVAATEGAALTNDSASADIAGTVQNVFADAAGTGGDTAKNGAHADTGFYEIATAAIAVNKTSFVMWDPINNYTNPKAIPGAIMVYCITVSNPSTTVPATAIGITDVVDTTYLADINTGATAGTIAFKLSEEGVDDPACNATTLIDSATDTSSGTAGDAGYKTAVNLVAKTDVDDAPDDGGYYDVPSHTVHVDTATLQAKGTGNTNVATAIFRVTIK